MKRLTIFAAALALAVGIVGMLARSPMAQTDAGVYEACEPQRDRIDAAALPGTFGSTRRTTAGPRR